MDIQPQSAQPISDDQELAKVLAGVNNDSDANFNFEETTSAETQTPEQTPEPVETPIPEPEIPTPVLNNPPVNQSGLAQNDLDGIKKEALLELRPLVEKLNLSPEEKFDIYLLLLRSTDDTTLIPPAYSTAQQIIDEPKRAQALLDIIKEIDFLSAPANI